jgi:hypothetical chaperone protein
MRWPSGAGPTTTCRTALCFRAELKRHERVVSVAAGPRAIDWALAPADNQRFVQSIKTHLGSAAFAETRIFGERYRLEGLISLFLRRAMAEGDGMPAPAIRVVAGRPVVFAGDRPDESLAVTRLKAAYAEAGLAEVSLAYEPLGAAWWYARGLARAETVLVADFGGGTSDFSVMRFEPAGGRVAAEALSHDGVGVAGDTFDFRIIDNAIAGQLGKRARYRSFGKWLPVPQHFFAAFSRWHQLSWLKGARAIADLEAITSASDEPEQLEALRTLIDCDLGLDLYAAVTAAKTRLSSETHTDLVFDRHGVRLAARIGRADFERWIAADIAAIEAALARALASARVAPGEVDAVFMTGGTSHVPAVRRVFASLFAPERIHIGDAFRSVASGLAIMARDGAEQGN